MRSELELVLFGFTKFTTLKPYFSDVGELGCFSDSPWIDLCDEPSWRMEESRNLLIDGAIDFKALFNTSYNDTHPKAVRFAGRYRPCRPLSCQVKIAVLIVILHDKLETKAK